MSTLGSNIKKYRELKNITQKQLAESIGKTKNVISNWETGLNKPDADTLEVLLYMLDVDANTLLGWDNPEQLKTDAEVLATEILSNPKIKKILPMIKDLSEKDLDFAVDFLKRLSSNKE